MTQSGCEIALMRLEADPVPALEQVLRRRRDLSRGLRIVIDQFEELFAVVADPDRRQRFMRRL